MLCFLDRTFCKSDCVNSDCFRFLSGDIKDRAKAWSESIGSDHTLIALSDFSGDCPDYIEE